MKLNKIMGLKALFYSTNFWTAIFAAIFGAAVFIVTKDHITTGLVFSAFLGRIAAKGWQDVAKSRIGWQNVAKSRIGGTNPPPEKDDK